MKRKDLKALLTMDDDELRKLLVEKEDKLREAQIAQASGKEKNLKKVRNLRREIAQVLTKINEKKIIEAEKGSVKV